MGPKHDHCRRLSKRAGGSDHDACLRHDHQSRGRRLCRGSATLAQERPGHRRPARTIRRISAGAKMRPRPSPRSPPPARPSSSIRVLAPRRSCATCSNAGNVNMPSEHLTILFTDRARDVLKVAAEKHAYTLVGQDSLSQRQIAQRGTRIDGPRRSAAAASLRCRHGQSAAFSPGARGRAPRPWPRSSANPRRRSGSAAMESRNLTTNPCSSRSPNDGQATVNHPRLQGAMITLNNRLLSGFLLAWASLATAQSIVLLPSKTNTLIQVTSASAQQLSNGLGDIYVGRTNQDGQGPATISIRRGLVAFDIADNIPAGATITGVTLTVDDVRGLNGNQTVSLSPNVSGLGAGHLLFRRRSGGAGHQRRRNLVLHLLQRQRSFGQPHLDGARRAARR